MADYGFFVDAFGSGRVLFNEPLSQHTYFKIGGPADVFITCETAADLQKAVSLALSYRVPFFLLGGGSNILVSDKGFRGLVIKNRTNSISIHGVKGQMDGAGRTLGRVFVEVESGVALNRLIRYCLEESLGGLEVFLGTPGTVGGAIYNNAHFETEFVGNHLVAAKILDQHGSVVEVNREYFKFGYDYSILHKTHEVVLTVTFVLTPGDKNELWNRGSASVEKRGAAQPVNLPSSGCIFRNNEGQPVGKIIDECGLKNARVGDAVVSDKHANFIVNKGQATAEDVRTLMKQIQNTVFEKTGVSLDPEIFLVGEF